MSKKIALITGASSGIGRDIARMHAKYRGDVVAVSKGGEKLANLKKELENDYKIKVICIEKDLSKVGAAKEIYDEVKKRGIEIDYLVNNAGFGGLGKFSERDWERDKAMINLNVLALVEMTRMFLPDFIKRNSGRILNTSSTASLLPGPFQAVYYATKAFVSSFSNAIAEELYDSAVTVTNLMPGPTKTDFGHVSGMNMTKLFAKTASSQEVAEAGYEAMLRGDLNVMGGVSFLNKLMYKMLPLVPKKILLKYIRKLQDV